MHTAVTVVGVMLALVACSKHEAPPSPVQTIRMYDSTGQRLVSLEADSQLRNPAGDVVGRYDVATDAVSVGNVNAPLASVRTIDGNRLLLDLPIGKLDVSVRGDEIWIDNKRFGSVQGMTASRDDMRRLSALVVAVLVLPKPGERDASVPDASHVEPPLPPPPPRPQSP